MEPVRDIVRFTWSKNCNCAKISSITNLEVRLSEPLDQPDCSVQSFIDPVMVSMLDCDHWYDGFYHYYTVCAESPTTNPMALWMNLRNLIFALLRSWFGSLITVLSLQLQKAASRHIISNYGMYLPLAYTAAGVFSMRGPWRGCRLSTPSRLGL